MCLLSLNVSMLGAQTPRLNELDKKVLQEKIRSDLVKVKLYRDGLRSVIVFAASGDFFPSQKLSKARMLTRENREAARETWKSFLDYLLALDALGQYYKDFDDVKGDARKNSLLIERTAFLAQYRFALEWIDLAERDPGLETLFNEQVPEVGLLENSYAHLKFRFLNVARAADFIALETAFEFFGDEKNTDLHAINKEDAAYLSNVGKGTGEKLTAMNALNMVKQAGVTAWFPIQAGVSEWMGDTKVSLQKHSLISQEQIKAIALRLQPGDMLLERREWYLSNIGLPGYWAHAALYIGSAKERRQYFKDPEVKAWVQKQGQAEGDLELLLQSKYPEIYATSTRASSSRVLEAVSEGVIFTALEHSADADCLAVLRPRLTKKEKAVAILRAYQYAGRPYDFNFDFLTDTSLVCTEVLYKAYEPSRDFRGISFPVPEILGHRVTPANEIVRQFDADFGKAKQQWDFVLFLDGNERADKAIETSVDVFRESWKRPKWHILTEKLPQMGQTQKE